MAGEELFLHGTEAVFFFVIEHDQHEEKTEPSGSHQQSEQERRFCCATITHHFSVCTCVVVCVFCVSVIKYTQSNLKIEKKNEMIRNPCENWQLRNNRWGFLTLTLYLERLRLD